MSNALAIAAVTGVLVLMSGAAYADAGLVLVVGAVAGRRVEDVDHGAGPLRADRGAAV